MSRTLALFLFLAICVCTSPVFASRPFRTRPLVADNNQTQIARSAPASLKVDRLEAQQFVLTDKNGKPRLTMNVNENNTVSLTISSGTLNGAAMLNVFEDGRTAFILRGPRGRNRVSISTRKTGQPTIYMTEDANIILANHKNQPRLVIGDSTEGGAKFFYYDDQGKVIQLIEKQPVKTQP